MSFLRRLRDHFPLNRRRRWKYVSPRRRRVGMIVLALLLALLYSGWYLTNPSRVRREAKQALEALIDADVDIDSASFRLFEGIRLRGVRIRQRDETYPFFTAREVVLRHEPLTLLGTGRLQPTEIHCVGWEVLNEYDADGRNNLMALARRSPGAESQPTRAPARRELPRVFLADGLIRTVNVSGQVRTVQSEKPAEGRIVPVGPSIIECVLIPIRNPEHQIRFQRDVDTGEMVMLSKHVSPEWGGVLPPKAKNWIDRHSPEGGLTLVNGPNTDPDKGRFELALKDFSFRLAEDEGGMRISSVDGRLLIDPDGVRLRDITGIVDEAGRARLELSGDYHGFAPDSPFEVQIRIAGAALPVKARGPLAMPIADLRRRFGLEGRIALAVDLVREAGKPVRADGRLMPIGAQMTYDQFPLPASDVRGVVRFDERQVLDLDLRARRGAARFEVTGTFGAPEARVYDVVVTGDDVLFESALRKAIGERYQPIWDELDPGGRTDVRVRVHRPSLEDGTKIEIDLSMDGAASLSYKRFPYRLENLVGQIEIRDGVASIPDLESRSGRMHCRIRGRVSGLDDRRIAADLKVDATDVPIDAKLRKALLGPAGKLLDEMDPAGRIRRLIAVVSQGEDKPLDYQVDVDLEDAAFTCRRMPCRVTGVRGPMVVTPETLFLGRTASQGRPAEPLTGKFHKAGVSLLGHVGLAGKQSWGLTIQADGLVLDKALGESLPETFAETWAKFQPAGRADVAASLSGQADTPTRYAVVLAARGMSLQYEDIPVPLTDVTGRIEFAPAQVTLTDVRGSIGKGVFRIAGAVESGERETAADLELSVRGLAVDKALLAALPGDLASAGGRLRPGGVVNADLSSLVVRKPSDPKAPATWSAEGSLAFQGADVDLGTGRRDLSGTLSGTMSRTAKGLAVDADVRLDSLSLKRHELTDVQARLAKAADSDMLRVSRLLASAYGGKVEGSGTFQFGKIDVLRMRLNFLRLDLGQLFNAGIEDPAKRADVQGKLAGWLSLEIQTGKGGHHRAEGRMEISRGKLYKMPVLLGLLNIIYLQLPSDSAFQQGTLSYRLRDDTLQFDEIFLTGRTLSVLGRGVLDLRTSKLDLTFLTGPPGRLPRLSELAEDILKAISGELMEIRIGGTLAKPKTTTHTLRSVETIIRRLTMTGPLDG